jgi:YD repeat-containing protein
MKSLPVIHRFPTIALPAQRRFALPMLFACLLLLAGPAAHGQMQTLDDSTSVPIEGAGHDYIKFLNETVNPANGSVSMRISLPIPKSRSITTSLSIDYDSNGVNFIVPNDPPDASLGRMMWQTNQTSNAGGWSLSVPSLTYSESQISLPSGGEPGQNGVEGTINCTIDSNYMFTDLGGGQHALNLGTEGYGYSACVGNVYQGGDAQVGAALTSETSNNGVNNFNATPVEVYTPDGTVYTFGGSELPALVEDRNGNILNFVQGGNGTGGPIATNFTATDTAGRTVISNSFGSPQTLTVGGLQYKIYWTNISTIVTPPSTWVGNQTEAEICGPFQGINTSQSAISQIVLPNGKSYSFTYDSTYGLLKKITYPSGAWVEYTWEDTESYNQLANFPGMQSQSLNCIGDGCGPPPPTVWIPVSGACLYQYAAPVVATRTVGYTSNSSGDQKQTFTYATNWIATGDYPNTSWSTKTTTVATADEDRGGISANTVYTYAAIGGGSNNPVNGGGGGSPISVEKEIDYYDYNGTPLQKVTKSWLDQYRLSSVSTYQCTLANPCTPSQGLLTGGIPSKEAYVYKQGSPFDLVVEKDEYDFGASSPTRSALTPYQSFTGLPYQVINTQLMPAFTLDRLELPTSETVCNGGVSNSVCANGEAAETDYSYDGLATTPVSGLPSGTHDETNYSPSQSTPRGNITTVTKKCVQGCTQSSVTQYAYDETGQPASMKDPNGNTTSYSFTDSPAGGNPAGNSNTYLTQIAYPSANGVAHHASFQYSYSSGYLTESDDENGQPTNYTYDDALLRPTEVQGPPDSNNSGQRPTTELAYDDSALTVTSTVTQSPNPSKTSIQSMDGMGHTVQTELTTDPYGADFVTTTYDGMGHAYTVSNPYRSGTPPATTYTYDALGRKVIQQNTDGTKQYWCYNGIADNGQPNCGTQIGSVNSSVWADFTDENGNHSQQSSDSFGRLETVIEDASNSKLETDYTYDLLNNLIRVNQIGKSGDAARVRTFSYDSLSRLLCASNPENSVASCPTTYSGYVTGTTGYSYDANGNVLSKKDARGVATNYSYDALNRVTAKTYSNDANKTPYSCFQYDTSSISGAGGNLIGRLTNEWTVPSSSSCAAAPTGTFYTLRSILNYDAMGRITNEQQCTPNSCTAGSGPTVSYGYDLAGNATSLTNSVGQVNGSGVTMPLVLTTSFDGASHMNSVTSNWTSFAPNLFTAASTNGYTAFGGLWNWSQGPVLSITQGYDPNRLWLNSITATGQIP